MLHFPAKSNHMLYQSHFPPFSHQCSILDRCRDFLIWSNVLHLFPQCAEHWDFSGAEQPSNVLCQCFEYTTFFQHHCITWEEEALSRHDRIWPRVPHKNCKESQCHSGVKNADYFYSDDFRKTLSNSMVRLILAFFQMLFQKRLFHHLAPSRWGQMAEKPPHSEEPYSL